MDDADEENFQSRRIERPTRSPPRASRNEETRSFYDRLGWQRRGERTLDTELFGTLEDGPIRQELTRVHRQRLRDALTALGRELDVLECGCGGHPEPTLLEHCAHYTGVDFSETGLEVAKEKLSSASVPLRLHRADVCALPFESERFDIVYSAHMIYHIDDPNAQRKALSEMMRVLRPGGTLLLVGANARPLLFPFRFTRRVLADAPLTRNLLQRVKAANRPLPYRPMPIGWMKRELSRYGQVEVLTHGLPSHALDRALSEYRPIGRLVWTAMRELDVRFPRASAHLGNDVLYRARRRGDPAAFFSDPKAT